VNAPATGPLCMRPSALVTRIHRTYFMELLINTTRGEVMFRNTKTVSIQPNLTRFAQLINDQVTSNGQILRSQMRIFVTVRAKVMSVPTKITSKCFA